MTSKTPILGLFVAGSLLLTAAAQAAVVASYSFTGNTGVSTDVDGSSVAGTFTGSAGVGFTSNNARFVVNTTGSTALGANTPPGGSYFEFTIAPGAGQQLALETLSFNFGGSGENNGTFTANLALRSSEDGFASNVGSVVSTPVVATSTALNPTYTSGSISLTALAPVTDSTAGLTFRLYVWDNSNTSPQAVRIDDVILNATVSAIPEPSTYAVVIGGLALSATALRRRRTSL